jgi:hypothetical protein
MQPRHRPAQIVRGGGGHVLQAVEHLGRPADVAGAHGVADHVAHQPHGGHRLLRPVVQPHGDRRPLVVDRAQHLVEKHALLAAALRQGVRGPQGPVGRVPRDADGEQYEPAVQPVRARDHDEDHDHEGGSARDRRRQEAVSR